MERTRQRDQAFANKIKEKPGREHAEQQLAKRDETGKTAPLQQRHRCQFPDTSRANGSIIVFGDTFAAEVLSAPRATRYSFAPRVIETPLMNQALGHGVIRGGTLGSSSTFSG